MVVPTLELLEPKMRPGAVLVVDNTAASVEGYKPFFEYIRARESKYRTLTLPYSGGLEMVTYVG